ncbi:hypothetical protein GOP47_0001771 [Adiantum capillus-veneris]|uniref:Alpha-glucosidase n=1 Tax=Adiantum capillus-veneris TaxID=13818 RepID=A0A9D4ZNE1_ADICA|nr:hypothetical protein GOP47_0001771 [Adiantum capillus-veneris]
MLSVKHLPPSSCFSLDSLQPISSPASKQLFCSPSLRTGKRTSTISYHKAKGFLPYCVFVEAANVRGMNPSVSTTVWRRILEDNVFRFDSTENAREEAWPSLSFADAKQREIPFEGVGIPEYYPRCAFEKDRQIMIFELPSGTSFYGTGEVSGPLERSGQRIFTWNSDAWGYGPSTTSLYQSHPWVLAVLPDGKALGLLADTTRRCEVDLRQKSLIKFVAPSPYPVISFGPFSSPAAVLRSLSHAIGTIGMPPKWSLGYNQCRWSYEPDSKVLEVARTFRDKLIPCDVLWMDIDYMDGFRCFTFDPKKFSSPNDLGRGLHSHGFKAVWMLDPGIKAEAGYGVYDSGTSQAAWILSSKEKTYIGEVWPGPCVFPDFTSKATRQWWAELVSKFVSDFVDGIWNDMNEPTVFKTVTKTMPDVNMHHGDAEIGGTQNHLHYHNVYGMLMARSTYEGMMLANSKKRPFVLTRAGFIGSQRYAATWTGDNLSTWDHLRMSIPMTLNLGMSGQPFGGPDIGGFAGDATPKLFARWMGLGALLPFCRGHSEKGTIDHEPWSFGAECENVCRLALERRYRLLPHIYTLFYNAHTTGEPVISPLFFADTKDPKLRDVEDSFLLGPLLVSASTDKREGSSTKKVNLPLGSWKEFNFDDNHEDLPLLFLKGGSILPTGPVVQNTGQLDVCNELTLVVALDDDGNAEGLLYEDDGDGFDYQSGKCLLTSYKATLQNDQLHVKLDWSRGHLQRPSRALNVLLLLGETAKVVFSGIDGEDIIFELPSAAELAELVADGKNKNKTFSGSLKDDDIEVQDPLKGLGAPRAIIELNGGEWKLKVVPWIGGRVISMVHSPTDIEWLWSRLEMSGYEEYSGTEYRSSGCTEEYNIIRKDIAQIGGNESVLMEADLVGGLALCRSIYVSKESPNLLQFSSSLVAKSNFAGSGGFSRTARLRIHPSFQLRHPTETFIRFETIDGKSQHISIESEELCLCGDKRPNGEWMIVDTCANVSLVNRFNVEEVEQCLICWGPGTCFLELWSPERPISKATPISIHHTYETVYVTSG